VPLTLEIFGDGPDRALIFGGIHGSEPTSAVVAERLADHLRIHWELFDGKTVAILARANPDGLARGTRTNANGVDLNRNFPASNWRLTGRGRFFGGSAPASEPETRAIIRAVEHVRPGRIISIHSTGRGTHCNNFDGPARALAEAMARHNRYPVKATMGYPTPGSFGTWAGIDRKIATITLELPNDLAGRRCWRDNLDALYAFLETGRPVGATAR
jgi:protein MpaA